MKGKVLNNSLADTRPEEKAKTLGETMGDVKAKLLVDMLLKKLEKANERK